MLPRRLFFFGKKITKKSGDSPFCILWFVLNLIFHDFFFWPNFGEERESERESCCFFASFGGGDKFKKKMHKKEN